MFGFITFIYVPRKPDLAASDNEEPRMFLRAPNGSTIVYARDFTSSYLTRIMGALPGKSPNYESDKGLVESCQTWYKKTYILNFPKRCFRWL